MMELKLFIYFHFWVFGWISFDLFGISMYCRSVCGILLIIVYE